MDIKDIKKCEIEDGLFEEMFGKLSECKSLNQTIKAMENFSDEDIISFAKGFVLPSNDIGIREMCAYIVYVTNKIYDVSDMFRDII